MRYFAVISFFLLLPATHAATPVKVEGASSFARKIARAENWDSLFRSVEGSISPLVLKELKAITNDLPYPQTRVKSDRLMISNENGEHLTMVLFEQEGDVSFNGKPWAIRPLAKTEDEINRITSLLGSARTQMIWDALIPSAHASGLGMTRGVAAAAYASAAAWKGEACAKPKLSDELVKTCSLMAVSMESSNSDDDKILPVAMKCPAENNGVLEFISKSKNGRGARIRVSYKAGAPCAVSIDTVTPENKTQYKTLINVNLNETMNEETKAMAEKAKIKGETLVQKVCQGPERERYLEFLSTNAKLVGATRAQNTSELIPNKSSSGL